MATELENYFVDVLKLSALKDDIALNYFFNMML